jgi:hypothetical protein
VAITAITASAKAAQGRNPFPLNNPVTKHDNQWRPRLDHPHNPILVIITLPLSVQSPEPTPKLTPQPQPVIKPLLPRFLNLPNLIRHPIHRL